MNFELTLKIIEYVGTIAFAISGAIIAIENKMDILGVIILGTTTAVGGGIMRDVIVGRQIPLIFENWPILLTAGLTTILVFIVFMFFYYVYATFKVDISNIFSFIKGLNNKLNGFP